MKRLLAFATAAALVVGATGTTEAQTRIAPRFDLGLYGGWTWTSPWFEDGGNNYGIGTNPIFGLNTTFWTTETFGVRLHGAYMPSRFPHHEGRPIAAEGYPLNNYFIDLDAVFRPWWARADMGNLMSSLYFWLGGGVLFTDVAGDPTPLPGNEYVCVPNYAPHGVCLSYEPGYASVGQGTIGIGADVMALAGNIGLFGELGAHGYSAPLHTGPASPATDRFAVTTRGVLGLKMGIGALAPPVVPVPPPPPPPAPAPPPPPAERQIQVCVVQNGQLQMVNATFRPATNDTVIGAQPFRTAHPATAPNYAAGANWFVQQDTMAFNQQTWVKFGVTRVIQPPQLQRVGDNMGTPVFAEAGRAAPYEVLYVPVRPGCEFQPYQPRAMIRPRG
jgi:hypothetical protein